jgi:hypothetical protein
LLRNQDVLVRSANNIICSLSRFSMSPRAAFALPIAWGDAAGTPIAVQQKLMRHSDIRTTLNVYGDVVTDEMAQANSKVAKMALSRAN